LAEALSPEEIRLLFRVVKAVADFPNVTYLLAFDQEVVSKALTGETQIISGQSYLEKIIQVPFELPLPDEVALRNLLFEKLDAILQDTPEELFDSDHWSDVYWEGIDHFIKTPRDVVRLINSLIVTYATVKGDVNPVDFVAIEALRIHCSPVYHVIRSNKEAFAGPSGPTRLFGRKAEDFKPFHNAWLEGVSEADREAVQHLTTALFPKLGAVWGRTSSGADDARDWRKDLRVCSLDIFLTYFRLSLPEGSVSRNEMQAILALTGDAEVFGLKLLELADQRRSDGTTQVGVVLERLLDYARDDIPVEAIPSIVKALFGVGDKLIRAADEDVGFFNRGNDARVTLLIEKLIPRLDPPDRYTVLKEGIENGQAVYIIVDVTTWLGVEHGRLEREPLPEDMRTVNATQLGELEALAAGKISEAAQHPALSSDSLLNVYSFGRVLYRWRDWGGQEQVVGWVERMLNEVTDDSQVTDQQLTTLRQFAESYRASKGT